MTDRELMQQSLDALEGNDLGLHYRTIDALRAALAQTAPAVPAVQIGMKASTWETLSSDAQTLILEAGQRAVDKAKAQRLADAAARGGMAQIPLDGSAAAPAVREPKPLAAVNRYCAAGMCLPKDQHEAGCTAHGIGTQGGGT